MNPLYKHEYTSKTCLVANYKLRGFAIQPQHVI